MQLPLLVEVNVNVTEPVESSEALGVYVAFNAALFGLKVPEPPVHTPVVVLPDTIPERTAEELFLHAIKSTPAFTEGGFVKLIKTLSLTWLQFPLLDELNVKFTRPAESSEALGV